jgi:dihydropteroate synthase
VSGAALDLRAGPRTLRLEGRRWLMGIVNATPDSFSDTPGPNTLEARLALAGDLIADGADIVDVGGESGVTDRPVVPVEEEVARVVPVIEALARGGDALVSVDTYKPAVAAAAIAAGAAMVNDFSGLRHPELADVCAETGAALVLTHTVAAPKEKVLDHPYADPPREVAEFLAGRIDLARSRGVAFEQLLLDPGPDLGKSPAQTIAVLADLGPVRELGRPILLAVSRKDFVGALLGRAPRERLAGTLAALGHGLDSGAHVLRVHDVRAAADYVAVRAALRGERPVPDELRLAEDLRREPRGEP